MPRPDWQEQFLDRIAKAIVIAKQKGAILNSEAVVGQAALESAWGQSLLTRRANNLFGIKGGSWTGPTIQMWTLEWYGRRDATGRPIYERVLAKWRTYESWNLCLVDYSNLIQRLWWFRDAVPFADPPEGNGNTEQWIAHLVDRDVSGELAWATGPAYIDKCMRIVSEIREEAA